MTSFSFGYERRICVVQNIPDSVAGNLRMVQQAAHLNYMTPWLPASTGSSIAETRLKTYFVSDMLLCGARESGGNPERSRRCNPDSTPVE